MIQRREVPARDQALNARDCAADFPLLTIAENQQLKDLRRKMQSRPESLISHMGRKALVGRETLLLPWIQ